MRRWNGWGDTAVAYPLGQGARRFLQDKLGPGTAPRDAALEEVVRRVPPTRLPPHPLVATDPEQRVRHALGQSFPDWVAARSGNIPAVPDGVAFPSTNEEIRELLRYAAEAGAWVIPYGGGTSVVGHLRVEAEGAPVLCVDMERMSGFIHLDEASNLATFGAGVKGPHLEAFLRARGFTLGHYPQSFEYSTLGGWVATRSKGHQALGYGSMEELFTGGRLEAPAGTLLVPPFPASAAGPDLRALILGSEGRAGILTEATVRVRRIPEAETFYGVFFPALDQGVAAVREIMNARVPLSMLRLSTPDETVTNLSLAGNEVFVSLLEGLVAMRGAGPGKCMLVLGASGPRAHVRFAVREALAIARRYYGVPVGRRFGHEWIKQRFRTPYLRNTLWELGYGVDTLETAASWSRMPSLIGAVEQALRRALEQYGERVFVFSHLSHPYLTGSNLYTTFLFRLSPDPQESLHRWQLLKSAASRAIVATGGTISHQHGVGLDHRPYLQAEKGALGLTLIASLCRSLDPAGIMNPGKLV
ncbi:MAG: FAD-binding oxidoreductase [Bacillota bacterium]